MNPLQATPNGGIEQFLRQHGVPFANELESAITFLTVLGVVYLMGRYVLLPIVDWFLEKREYDRHIRVPVSKLTHALILATAIGAGIGFAGFGNILTSLATIAAASTLAIGISLQNVIRNFVAGLFIFTDRPFRIGDEIQWDGNHGVVHDISLRVTRVKTLNNEVLTVPNSELTDGVIMNPVKEGPLRLQIEFGIGYEDDVHHATDLILEEAERHPEILDDPEPSVVLTELGGSSVTLQARVWIRSDEVGARPGIRSDFITGVKYRFEDEGINIPYPHRTLTGDIELSDSAPESAMPSESLTTNGQSNDRLDDRQV